MVFRAAYTHSEEEKIVKWIADNKRFGEVKGNSMWRIMQDKKILGDRTEQSMKERFRKKILPRIDIYSSIDENAKARFRDIRKTQTNKTGPPKQKNNTSTDSNKRNPHRK